MSVNVKQDKVQQAMYDPEELVWLGGPSTEVARDEKALDDEEEHEEHAVWDRENWDCPTDILYHHLENEDHIQSKEVSGEVAAVAVKLSNVKIQDHPPHPMFAYQPFNGASLGAVREPYDPSTWDSPTDILYSHAEHDDVGPSALGLDIHLPPAMFTPSPLHIAPMKPQQRVPNSYGAAREPYDAETWDSPTDILYSHGKGEDEDDYTLRRKSSGEVDSPYTPYSALIATPVDRADLLPVIGQEDSELKSRLGVKTVDDDFIVRAGRRLVETLER